MKPESMRASAIVFEDGLGPRHQSIGGAGEVLEILTLRPDLIAVPSFDFALRERVATLAAFQHDNFARIRGIERVDAASTLAVVADCAQGVRLSTILMVAETRRLAIETNAAMFLIRQLVTAVGALHEQLPGVAHGAIAPERIVVTPGGRLVIVEHGLGAALQQLHYTQERYWSELRIALPTGLALPMLDACADVTQIGVVALALFLGRPLKSREYPLDVAELAGEATLTTPVRAWLTRALQLDPIGSFGNAIEARAAFNDIPGCDIAAERLALKRFIAQAPNAQPSSSPKNPKSSRPSETRPPNRPAPPPIPKPAPKPIPKPAAAVPARPAPEPPKKPLSRPGVSARRRRLGAAALFVLMASGGHLAARYLVPDPIDTTGTLAVSTTPAGVAVYIDGRARGVTPINARLAAGAHLLEIGKDQERRRIPVTILPGGHVTHFIDLPTMAAAAESLEAAAETGGVEGADNPGAGSGEVAAPATGWIAVSAPAELQVFEGNRLVGTTRANRLELAAGEHQLVLVNETLGYRSTRTVTVAPGAVAAIKPAWPKGSIALNAIPWADVFIGGERIGETPIGKIEIPIGSHDIVFRHPEHGEKRAQAVVTLKAPARVSVDMRAR